MYNNRIVVVLAVVACVGPSRLLLPLDGAMCNKSCHTLQEHARSNLSFTGWASKRKWQSPQGIISYAPTDPEGGSTNQTGNDNFYVNCEHASSNCPAGPFQGNTNYSVSVSNCGTNWIKASETECDGST